MVRSSFSSPCPLSGEGYFWGHAVFILQWRQQLSGWFHRLSRWLDGWKVLCSVSGVHLSTSMAQGSFAATPPHPHPLKCSHRTLIYQEKNERHLAKFSLNQRFRCQLEEKKKKCTCICFVFIVRGDKPWAWLPYRLARYWSHGKQAGIIGQFQT